MSPRILLAAIVISLGTGCATGLNSAQKAELDHYEARGLAVVEKNPGTGAALGLLPGGGSFYGREYGFGVVNLLFWPLSILWDPISGYDASRAINYQATKAHVDKLKEKEIQALDDQLGAKQIDLAQYTLEKRKIEKKFDAL
ncbi:hypothetical protein FXN65_25760 [Metapseudomonas lalkuanensis]|uniref:Lipoprotein n=1 Tax=Metapseudomonas lalkuanensis TaxID=2604832 RepID=A0A5J6QUF7_9GAMM|nr:hypothetical protein [Pseudomonas lalkuanensis]QEY65295.1 hypothetical protein FXN65_25760 [Pseudomonas lalkuanensis]UCO97809.1 hypothetical protein LF844_24655 [Pseudomonas lalkuanensis]